MNAECITIGDELLLGQTLDTNAAFIGERLAGTGIRLRRVVSVGDDAALILDALERARDRADLVILTGGLGPTHDDITKAVVASALGSGSMVMDREVGLAVRGYFRGRGMPMPAVNLDQALVPCGFRTIPNRWGTAPGLIFERGGKMYVIMPGVPREMRGMMDATLVPMLRGRSGGHVILYRKLRTSGIAESALFELLDNLDEIRRLVEVAFLPKHTGVTIRLTAEADDPGEATGRLERATGLVMDRVARYVHSTDGEALEEALATLLIHSDLTIAVAESCTGGLVSHSLTNIPGSSAYFLLGTVVYSNTAKRDVLGIDEGLLLSRGAVSGDVACAMAESVAGVSGADIGLGVTGIAGPDGGSEEKPVGLVHLAVWMKGRLWHRKVRFIGDRKTNKESFAAAAMGLVYDAVRGRG